MILASIVGAFMLRDRGRLENVQTALDRHDFERADTDLRRYLASYPHDAEAHLLAAQLARRALVPVLPSEADPEPEVEKNQIGSRMRAEEHINLFRKHGGEVERARLERYLLRAQVGELEAVEGDLMALVRQDIPESARILEALAAGNLVRYRLAEARYCLDEWVKRQPQPPAFVWRGFIHERCREPARAEEDYRRCLELAPDNVEAVRRLADLLRSTESEEALRLYRVVTQQRPGDIASLLGQARCQAALGREDEARVALDELLRDHPNHGGALVERGKLDLGNPSGRSRGCGAVAAFPATTKPTLFCIDAWNWRETDDGGSGRLDDIEADINRLHEITVARALARRRSAF